MRGQAGWAQGAYWICVMVPGNGQRILPPVDSPVLWGKITLTKRAFDDERHRQIVLADRQTRSCPIASVKEIRWMMKCLWESDSRAPTRRLPMSLAPWVILPVDFRLFWISCGDPSLYHYIWRFPPWLHLSG
jgi:hypothetical protein